MKKRRKTSFKQFVHDMKKAGFTYDGKYTFHGFRFIETYRPEGHGKSPQSKKPNNE